MKKRTYKADSVEQLDGGALVPALSGGCIVALDVAKHRFAAAFARADGEVVRLVRFQHPVETPAFLRAVEVVRGGIAPGVLKAAMEPTGTYGDAIRGQLVRMGVPVWMVSPKRTHDSKELFDSVPSMHDPKAATLIARLCALGLATEWKPPPAARTRMRALVELRAHEVQREEVCLGRLEALLARHWPEFEATMNVRKQKTAARLLVAMPSPRTVAGSPAVTREFVRRSGRGKIDPSCVDELIQGATTTVGVEMSPEEEAHVRTLAIEALEAADAAHKLELAMTKLGAADEVFRRLAAWMGVYTAAVVTTLCDPRQYASARQLEKACGLNLRETSSGENRGRWSIRITKRGPGAVRRVLFLFALRMIEHCKVARAWYQRRSAFARGTKRSAVIALMRKLVRAIFHVARGAAFDATKLFDTRRLKLESASATSVEPEGAQAPLAPPTARQPACKEVAAA